MLITQQGAALLANTTALGIPLKLNIKTILAQLSI